MEEMAKKRPLSADDVADWFINKAVKQPGEVITPLETQRLVYFSHAWYLANKGLPLFADEFEAWATGPIVRSTFARFENFSFTNLPEMKTERIIKGDKLEMLEEIWERYGCYKGRKLDEMSREPGGPWETARGKLAPEAASDTVISNESIKKHYGEKIGKAWA